MSELELLQLILNELVELRKDLKRSHLALLGLIEEIRRHKEARN